MTGMAHVGDVVPASTDSKKFNGLAYRHALFVVALMAIVVGALLLANPLGTLAAYAPFALLAIGSGALAALVGLYSASTRPPRSRAPLPSPDATASQSPEETGPPLGAPSRVPRGPGITNRGSEWRVLSLPSDPGDETWMSWLPRVHRRLGPEAAGYTGGVSYSPGRPGSLVAVPRRKSDPAVSGTRPFPGSPAAAPPAPGPATTGAHRPSPPSESAPAPPSRSVASRTFSDEELDRMFPPPSHEGPIFLTDIPKRIGVAGRLRSGPSAGVAPLARGEQEVPPVEPRLAIEEEVDSVGRSRSLEGGASGSSRPRDVGSGPHASPSAAAPPPAASAVGLHLEAENPIPPHLRSAGLLVRAHPSGAGRTSAAVSKSVCASCSKVVVNLRMSGPCPRCLRPICHECLRSALASYGHGWCVDCLPAFHVSVT